MAAPTQGQTAKNKAPKHNNCILNIWRKVLISKSVHLIKSLAV